MEYSYTTPKSGRQGGIVYRENLYENRRSLYHESEENEMKTRSTRTVRKAMTRRDRRAAYSPGGTPSRMILELKSDSEDGDSDADGSWKPISIPDGLKYGGKSDWAAFKQKFIRCAAMSKWTENQRRDVLCCCLKGEASSFYTDLTSDSNKLFYLHLSQLMRLWPFSYSVNSFFKRACAAVQWG